MTIPGSSSGRTRGFGPRNPGSNPGPGTNAALLAREAAPLQPGALVRHKTDKTTVMVVVKIPSYERRDCAWIDNNRRYEETFSLAEIEPLDVSQSKTPEG